MTCHQGRCLARGASRRLVDGVSPIVEDLTGLLECVTDDFDEDGFGVGILLRHLPGRPEQLMGLVGRDLPVLP